MVERFKCQKCKGHLYSLYVGGRKEVLVDHYYCKDCDTISHEHFEVIRTPLTKPTITFSEEDLAKGIRLEQERVF